MTDIKKKLLQEINLKAEKIKQQRAKAKNNKSVEDFVVDFFKEAEALNIFGSHEQDPNGYVSRTLILGAVNQLEEQIKIKYDRDVKVNASFDETTGMVRDITITWSKFYQVAQKCEETLRIGAEVLIFR